MQLLRGGRQGGRRSNPWTFGRLPRGLRPLAMTAYLLLISAILPDAAQTLRFIASADPCGRIICCCKEMCRITQNTPKCHMATKVSCGVVAFNTVPPAISVPERDLGMTSTFPFLNSPTDYRQALNLNSSMLYDSLTRSPSERPPALLA